MAVGTDVVEVTEGEGDGGARARFLPAICEAAADMLPVKDACWRSRKDDMMPVSLARGGGENQRRTSWLWLRTL